VHRAALAFAVAGSSTHQLGDHPLEVSTLGNDVAVAAMGCCKIVVAAKDRTDPHGRCLLTDGKVDEPGDLTCREKLSGQRFKLSDRYHKTV